MVLSKALSPKALLRNCLCISQKERKIKSSISAKAALPKPACLCLWHRKTRNVACPVAGVMASPG